METYKKLYPTFNRFLDHIEKYAIANDCVNDSFYVAKRILIDLFDYSHKSDELAVTILDYVTSGGTIKLKKLLSVDAFYNENNLIHFNAMALIDSSYCSFTK